MLKISAHNSKSFGFTIIELLVVVAIIAILSAIGITVFTQAQAKARDGRRIADINAIAQALEVNRDSSGYNRVVGSQFASGNIPIDPKADAVIDTSRVGCGSTTDTTNRCWYCFKASGASATFCDTSNDKLLNTNFSDTSGTTYLKTSWTVCANLETGSPKYYCKSSSQ